MGTKHKHYDVIVAWAAGEEIQYFWGFQWRDWEETTCPAFTGTAEWRIKPKRVKKEGWVNVYYSKKDPDMRCAGIYKSQREADQLHGSINLDFARVACIRIEWEEEV